ncbi:hypothetical protein PHAVU_007G217200 [Phaseolus vulgaris]|uniref:Uncharacterized protein n=1 Tax=Phaseolus vulgaris TaxID=3885 RepID=V7BJH3_PHAVU|nr:hypothetical protein PHAVU_007G217200g [Phaseolus vulgaris]ESW17173.1 hypothetical protein PHAVU_007G217200g [Phaseolus vulgaris]
MYCTVEFEKYAEKGGALFTIGCTCFIGKGGEEKKKRKGALRTLVDEVNMDLTNCWDDMHATQVVKDDYKESVNLIRDMIYMYATQVLVD